MTDAATLTRSRTLKTATHNTHDRLDKAIMAGRPFENRERYGLFLAVQQPFHRDIDALYDDERLTALIPDLAERRRLAQIEQDMMDLGLTIPASDEAPRLSNQTDLPTALGWLYVAEGSNLGAAFLFKMALKLGLSDSLGARHLAGHPDGRANHWRQFTGALDGLDLTPEEEGRMIAGANAAFERVHGLVKDVFS
ncbi:MAG: biliverdin-producing heme oxygenase [Candidatus Brevundimonas colombiensis]|uniref:Biliverdin-producing heme oxygenase n=1 Tax=Candidatus Brevundimonas colombiensis TaxID=3121376 RepID=A0AAJ5X2X2_9CAUL|nr:biliverdin-producing heme oxygenase [Brevundimonas sp.]WEK40127.1 MAG: biliverdin-producing heme oxygenase [Brevundimonas sp.]